MTTQTHAPPLNAVHNLSTYHREHEKHYSEAPLRDAVELQRMARTLMALAERWTTAEPVDEPLRVPFAGAPDLNDERAIEESGVLFMEGDAPPVELEQMRDDLARMGAAYVRGGDWLQKAMEIGWASAGKLAAYPQLADLLGERHRIVANDSLSGSMQSLLGRHLERASALLERVDFTPAAVRADLANGRESVGYLYSAAELIARAADLAAESAALVHDNERRWRVFRERVERIESGSA